MAQDESVYVFPDAVSKATGIDPNLLLALNNNGGFGGNGNWIWIIFLWMIWGNNGWGNNGFGGNNGTGYLANQISNSEGRDLLLQAINGRADAAAQLASITNTSVETVKNGIMTLQNSINQIGKAKAATCNSFEEKVSVVLFNKHNTDTDYINSIVHEAEHIKQAILKVYSVEDDGESAAYTVGYIVSKMYNAFKNIIRKNKRRILQPSF